MISRTSQQRGVRYTTEEPKSTSATRTTSTKELSNGVGALCGRTWRANALVRGAQAIGEHEVAEVRAVVTRIRGCSPREMFMPVTARTS